MSDTENLSPEQLKAIYALTTHGDKVKAARAAGVSRSTIYRWMEEPPFRQALDAATRQALKEFSLTLVGLAQLAAMALADALDKKQDIGVRLRAADIVTNRLLAVRELVDIEERITRLEAINHEEVEPAP